LLKQTDTLSKHCAMRRASARMSLRLFSAACAVAALKRRAPSRCRCRPLALGQVGRSLHVLEGQQLAAQRVLQRQQPRAREVRVVGLDGGLDLRERQRAVGRMVQRLRLHAAEHRGAAAFPAVAVRLLADDVFVATAAVRKDRAQVALRAGRHEQRRLEAQQRGDLFLQRVDARVGAEDVVAQRRRHHGLAHRGRGLRDGVAAQVDEGGAVGHGEGVSPGSS
jgi:hypothetical protein